MCPQEFTLAKALVLASTPTPSCRVACRAFANKDSAARASGGRGFPPVTLARSHRGCGRTAATRRCGQPRRVSGRRFCF